MLEYSVPIAFWEGKVNLFHFPAKVCVDSLLTS